MEDVCEGTISDCRGQELYVHKQFGAELANRHFLAVRKESRILWTAQQSLPIRSHFGARMEPPEFPLKLPDTSSTADPVDGEAGHLAGRTSARVRYR